MISSENSSPLSRQAGAFVSPALRQITLEVQKVDGVNLGQGTCQLPTPSEVVEAAAQALRNGVNRYTDPRGLASLREAIAAKLTHFNRIPGLDPERNVLATSGTTGAFETVCATLLDPGDEVLLFEPYYPYHLQALRRYQANVRFVPLLGPEWELDDAALRAALTPRTKFLLLNTPGNPTGKVFTREEFVRIAALLQGTETLVVTDEIYEYMTFDGRAHLSPAAVPELRDRVVTMGGYSKTFSITGWRVGYLSAPEPLIRPLAQTMDAIYVCPPAPLQQGVAEGIAGFQDDFYEALRAKYEGKRDRLAAGLAKVGLRPFRPQGAYYLLASYEAPELSSREFVSRMIAHTGVGAVPSDDFVRDASQARWVRFCCAVEDAVLDDALHRLTRL